MSCASARKGRLEAKMSSDMDDMENLLQSLKLKNVGLDDSLKSEQMNELTSRFVKSRAVLSVHIRGLPEMEKRNGTVFTLSFVHFCHLLIIEGTRQRGGDVLNGVSDSVMVCFTNVQDAFLTAMALKDTFGVAVEHQFSGCGGGLSYGLGWDDRLWALDIGCMGNEANRAVLVAQTGEVSAITTTQAFRNKILSQNGNLPEGYEDHRLVSDGWDQNFVVEKHAADESPTPPETPQTPVAETTTTPVKTPETEGRRRAPQLLLGALQAVVVTPAKLSARAGRGVVGFAGAAIEFTVSRFEDDEQEDLPGLIKPPLIRTWLSEYMAKPARVQSLITDRFERKLAVVVTEHLGLLRDVADTPEKMVRALEEVRVLREMAVEVSKRYHGIVLRSDEHLSRGQVCCYFDHPTLAVQYCLILHHEYDERKRARKSEKKLHDNFDSLEASMLAALESSSSRLNLAAGGDLDDGAGQVDPRRQSMHEDPQGDLVTGIGYGAVLKFKEFELVGGEASLAHGLCTQGVAAVCVERDPGRVFISEAATAGLHKELVEHEGLELEIAPGEREPAHSTLFMPANTIPTLAHMTFDTGGSQSARRLFTPHTPKLSSSPISSISSNPSSAENTPRSPRKDER